MVVIVEVAPYTRIRGVVIVAIMTCRTLVSYRRMCTIKRIVLVVDVK